MARITVTPNKHNVKFPGQKGNLLKIMQSDFEPPLMVVNGVEVSPYLWEDEDGYLYVYYNKKWIYINKYISITRMIDKASNKKNIADSDLNELKQILLDKISLYIRMNGSVPEWLEERLANVENEQRDNAEYDSQLRALIQQLDEENDKFIIADDE